MPITRRTSNIVAIEQAKETCHERFVSCGVCQHTVLSAHSHRITQKIRSELSSVYVAWPGLSESLATQSYVCCAHFVSGHPSRVTSPAQVSKIPRIVELPVYATREQRSEMAASKRKRKKASVVASKVKRQRQEPFRSSSRSPGRRTSLENPIFCSL